MCMIKLEEDSLILCRELLLQTIDNKHEHRCLRHRCVLWLLQMLQVCEFMITLGELDDYLEKRDAYLYFRGSFPRDRLVIVTSIETSIVTKTYASFYCYRVRVSYYDVPSEVKDSWLEVRFD